MTGCNSGKKEVSFSDNICQIIMPMGQNYGNADQFSISFVEYNVFLGAPLENSILHNNLVSGI